MLRTVQTRFISCLCLETQQKGMVIKMTNPIKSAGYFFESRIPVFLLNGHYYAANGWNGEEYLDSWECVNFKYDTGYGVVPGSNCTLRPVYVWQVENIDLDGLDEASQEFEDAIQIADFNIV